MFSAGKAEESYYLSPGGVIIHTLAMNYGTRIAHPKGIFRAAGVETITPPGNSGGYHSVSIFQFVKY